MLEKDRILVSVIMSCYNEKEREIYLAIDSIIKQTYKNWELILICDNPKRVDLYTTLKKIYRNEKRIKIELNSKNIGLALSMNKAAKMASGKYLMRMDSDDICLETRMVDQLNYMITKELDLCCTNFIYIDEEDKQISIEYKMYNNYNLKKLLPFENTIHHPTVMLKKECFDRVDGYRNFPCSQDYDLWLRLYDIEVRMGILKKVLLKYRIRRDSISQANRMKQINTIWYIQKCFWKRKKGIDIYSTENYNKYLKKNKVFDKKVEESFNKYKEIKFMIDLYRKKKKMDRCFLIIFLICKSEFYRKYYFKMLENKMRYYFLENINKIK